MQSYNSASGAAWSARDLSPPGSACLPSLHWPAAAAAFTTGDMNQAQLRALLQDCLVLWDVAATVSVGADHLAITTPAGVYTVAAADPDLRPVRWLYQTPDRAVAGRPPRAAPSVVALLSALRNAMEGAGGDHLRIAGR